MAALYEEFNGSDEFKKLAVINVDPPENTYKGQKNWMTVKKIVDKLIMKKYNRGKRQFAIYSNYSKNHWTAVFIDFDAHTVEYMDSLKKGQMYKMWPQVVKKINKDSGAGLGKIVQNKHKYQVGYVQCGMFALWWLIERAHGRASLKEMNKKKKSFGPNDEKMRNLRYEYFNVDSDTSISDSDTSVCDNDSDCEIIDAPCPQLFQDLMKLKIA